MDSKDEWENLHRQNRFRPKYPNEAAVQWMFRNFKRDKTEKVLDIGCGAGRHTFMLAKENIIPYGIDISMPGVEYTREILRTNGDFGEYTNNIVCGTFSELLFEDNFFDGAMAYGSLYYSDIAGIKRAIGEMSRVMKNGGRGMILVRGLQDYRYGSGKEIEKNTFIIEYNNEHASANAENGMVMHFFTKEELTLLCTEVFSSVSIDSICVTTDGGKLANFDYVVNVVK